MSEQPGFLRKHSKQEHSDERNETAARIREARAERGESLEAEENETIQPALSEGAAETVESYTALDADVTRLTESGVAEVNDLTNYAEGRQRLGTQGGEIPAQFAEPKKLLDDFYNKERERWASSKGNLEEAKELFTEKHLASLPMDQYVLLLKRFPNAMVTHVTRQGIRDHTGMHEHSAGKGEFSDGFIKMLESGELKSALAVAAVESGKESAIAKALKIDKMDSREEAENHLENMVTTHLNNDSYADRAAIHVATEAVADHYYGSERGNEIFIAFPSAHIAAEHQFIGSLSENKDLHHNDTWVLRDNELDKGMDINAGVAFIPAEARVDPKTGSRYEIGHNSRLPVENESMAKNLERLAENPEFMEIADTIRSTLEQQRDHEWLPPPSTWDQELEDGSYERKDFLKALLPIRDRIKELSGIDDDRVLSQIIDYHAAGNLTDSSDFGRAPAIGNILERSGTRYVEAKETISSQEFWEAHFAEHPEQRPSKIEYYKGDNPTAALLSWKKRHGLTDAGSESSYDVGGKTNVDTHASEDKDRFRSIGKKIIEENFVNGPQTLKEGEEIKKERLEREDRASTLDELVVAWRSSGKGSENKATFDQMWSEAHSSGLLDDPSFYGSFNKAMTGSPDYNAFRE